MTIPSLKVLAIPVAVDAAIHLSGNERLKPKTVLPDEIENLFVKYVLEAPAERQKALAHVICPSIEEFWWPLSKGEKNTLGIIFGCFTGLKRLRCAAWDINSAELKELFEIVAKRNPEQLLNITSIDLSRTKITDIQFLSFTPNVENLDLSGCKLELDDDCMCTLSSLKKLKTLRLNDTKVDSLKGVPRTVVELNLTGCQIPPTEFEELATHCKNLKKLNLSGTNIENIKCIPEMVEELDLSDCRFIPREQFEQLGTQCKKLNKLILRNTTISSLKGMPENVEEIDFSNCDRISSRDLSELYDCCKSLKKLISREIKIFSLSGIPKSVKEIDLTGCNFVSPDEFIRSVRNYRGISVTILDAAKVRYPIYGLKSKDLKKR